jgi:hypothetical protein
MIPTRGVRLLGLRADTKGRSLVSENFTWLPGFQVSFVGKVVMRLPSRD